MVSFRTTTSESCKKPRDKEAVKAALRAALEEDVEVDAEDVSFLVRLQDWLGEDEALKLGNQTGELVGWRYAPNGAASLP